MGRASRGPPQGADVGRRASRDSTHPTVRSIRTGFGRRRIHRFGFRPNSGVGRASAACTGERPAALCYSFANAPLGSSPEDAPRGRIGSRPAPGEETLPQGPLVEDTHRGSAFEKETALVGEE